MQGGLAVRPRCFPVEQEIPKPPKYRHNDVLGLFLVFSLQFWATSLPTSVFFVFSLGDYAIMHILPSLCKPLAQGLGFKGLGLRVSGLRV